MQQNDNLCTSNVIDKSLSSIPTTCAYEESSNNFIRNDDSQTIPIFSLSRSETNNEACLDIGNYVGKSVNDFIKRQLLLNPWMPPKNYNFPYSIHNKQGKPEKRYAKQQHLDQFNWLVFSEAKKGYFCKYCPFFVNNAVGGRFKTVHLKNLVTQPLTSFAKVLGKDGDLMTHENCDYHKNAVTSAKQFLVRDENPELNIANQIDDHRLKQIKENRARLEPIVESIIFLGRQNIALRGHRDDGPLDLEKSDVNEGNFRELLRYRVNSGDLNLKQHLAQSSSRATYISKTTQNELIHCCGEEILSVILNRLSKAKFWVALFDETQDIFQISQMSLVFRYFYENMVYEDFIGFLDVLSEMHNMSLSDGNEYRSTGINLGKIVLEKIKKLNLDLKFCVGVGTDGCSVMVSETCGAVETVRKEAINAVPTPCYNHKLNNAISKSSKVQAVRNVVGTMKETISFFKASAKRNDTLLSVVGHKLSGLCETRWVERHDGVMQFREMLPKIVEALDQIALWQDTQTSAKAKSLALALCESEFLVTLVSLSDLLSTTKPLSQFFQKVHIDVKAAQDLLEDVKKVLKRKREKADEKFKSLFEEICGIAQQVQVEIKMPRVTNRQLHRSNYPARDCESYYRQSVYIPIVESVVEDLKLRFPDETINLYYFSVLIPDSAYFKDQNLLQEAATYLAAKYYSFFDRSEKVVLKMLLSELELWKEKWTREKYDCTFSAIQLINFCDCDIYPTLHVLFRILITLPISIASPERTFSTLRRLKTWLRSTIAQDRLNGLALLHIHRDPIDVQSVIDRFAKTKTHRLEFVL